MHGIWDPALGASYQVPGLGPLNLIFCKTHMAREAGASVGWNCGSLLFIAEIPSPRPGVRGLRDQFVEIPKNPGAL